MHPAEVIDGMNLSHSQRFISLAYPCKHTALFRVKAFGHYGPALMNVIIGQRSSVEIISAHAYYNLVSSYPFKLRERVVKGFKGREKSFAVYESKSVAVTSLGEYCLPEISEVKRKGRFTANTYT